MNASPAPSPYPYQPRPDHPDATAALVMGILGLVLCQLISPFAWARGSRVVREIDASGGAYGGRSTANAGRICGIIGTVLMVGVWTVLIGLFVVGVSSSG